MDYVQQKNMILKFDLAQRKTTLSSIEEREKEVIEWQLWINIWSWHFANTIKEGIVNSIVPHSERN